MKRRRFTQEQIIGILKEHEAGVLWPGCAANMASATPASTSGKPATAGLEVSEAKRLKALEDENNRLNKPLAEAMLDITMLPEDADTNKRHRLKKMVTPAARREAVAHLTEAYE